MSVSDFLFQGSAPSSFTTAATAGTDTPAWYNAARQQLITRASQIAGEPYQAFTGPRVAGFNEDQLSAMQKTRDTVSAGNPYATQAADLYGKQSQGFNQDEFNSYMNPYSGQMMDELGRQASKNLNENLLPAVNDTFTGAGMFGSTRHGDFSERALRDTQESLLGQQAGILNTNYNNAMNSYNQGLDRAGQAGQNYGALGQQVFNQGIQGAAALDTIGGAQQGQTQKSYDTAYQDFIDQRDAPQKNLDLMSGVINAYEPTGARYVNQTQPLAATDTTPSPLAKILMQASQGGYA